MRIVKVPKEKRPTAKGLAKLEQEIKAQVEKNNVMSFKSWENAKKQ